MGHRRFVSLHVRHPPASEPPSARLPAIAGDLEAREEAVAMWFQGMERAVAPDTLRAAVLTRHDQTHGAARRIPRRAALGWGAAAAAAVVVGALLWSPWSDRGNVTSDPAQGPGFVVVDDQDLGLMHAIETFDHVGYNRRSDLIAHWGRK